MKAPPQKRYQTVEQQFDDSDEARQLNRRHLWDNTFESFGNSGW
jgi:hypothetical protein